MGRSISQLLLGPHAPNFFGRFLRHIRTCLDYLGGVNPPVGRVLVPRNEARLSKYMGSGEVNNSASIRDTCTKCFWRLLRHVGTFVDPLGGVDTPMGRALAPKNQAKMSKCMGKERSISQLLLEPLTPSFFGGS